MSGIGRPLGSVAALPLVWARGLLRFFQEQTRHPAFSPNAAPHHQVVPAGRSLDVVLHRRDVIGVSEWKIVNVARQLNRVNGQISAAKPADAA